VNTKWERNYYVPTNDGPGFHVCVAISTTTHCGSKLMFQCAKHCNSKLSGRSNHNCCESMCARNGGIPTCLKQRRSTWTNVCGTDTHTQLTRRRYKRSFCGSFPCHVRLSDTLDCLLGLVRCVTQLFCHVIGQLESKQTNQNLPLEKHNLKAFLWSSFKPLITFREEFQTPPNGS